MSCSESGTSSKMLLFAFSLIVYKCYNPCLYFSRKMENVHNLRVTQKHCYFVKTTLSELKETLVCLKPIHKLIKIPTFTLFTIAEVYFLFPYEVINVQYNVLKKNCSVLPNLIKQGKCFFLVRVVSR